MITAVAKAMFTPASRPAKGTNRGSKVPPVVIATTAMLKHDEVLERLRRHLREIETLRAQR
jgi:hypothetical protein